MSPSSGKDDFATEEEFLAHLARNRKQTVAELRSWLREMNMFPGRCDKGPGCGTPHCRGWRLYWPED